MDQTAIGVMFGAIFGVWFLFFIVMFVAKSIIWAGW